MKRMRTLSLVIFSVITVLAVGVRVGIAQKKASADLADYKCIFVKSQYQTANGTSDFMVPLATSLSQDMEATLDELSRAGYEITHISPVTRGSYEKQKFHDGGWEAGWSFCSRIQWDNSSVERAISGSRGAAGIVPCLQSFSRPSLHQKLL